MAKSYLCYTLTFFFPNQIRTATYHLCGYEGDNTQFNKIDCSQKGCVLGVTLTQGTMGQIQRAAHALVVIALVTTPENVYINSAGGP